MAGSRGMFTDESPRRRAQREEREGDRRGQRRDRHAPLVNTKPATAPQHAPLPNPVLTVAPRNLRVKPKKVEVPSGPRATVVMVKWMPDRGFGFGEDYDGGRYFVHSRDLMFDEREIAPGTAIECTAIEDGTHMAKTGKASRIAKFVTLSEKPVVERMETFVVCVVPERYGFVKDTVSHDRNMMFPAYVFPDAIEQEDVVAYVMETAKGAKCVRIERRA